MLLRLSLLSILFVLTSPLRGQSEPVHMRPEFSLTFPLAQSGRDVTVKFPILVNPTTVLKPGMVLRVMYILNSANPDGSTDLVLAQKGTLEQSYARDPAASLEKANSNMSPEAVHEVEGYRRTIWEVPNNFILAMAQYPTDAMHLIYSPTGKNQDLHDERFSFFDGLLVGLPDGKVTVLAVEKQSKAEKAGLKAGDEIISVGGASMQNDLTIFATAYAAAKKAAKENEVAGYPMTIRAAGSTETRTINIALPPRIKSGLMDGFLDPPPKPAPPPAH